ncbi:MAG: class I SAM-dependent methyltransferase [Crocinitomicaceae bacterium]|nr:class I SAM-dependent methyltransferase [Crocinitomicaceae bacterium]
MEGEYYHTKESVEEYVNLAKDVSGKQLIDKLNDYLEDDSALLEIGSGPGTDWKLLSDKHSVVGSDNSAEFLAH